MFIKSLITAINETSPIVIGIDPHLGLMHPQLKKDNGNSLESLANLYQRYGETIIDAVEGLVPAIKPQGAFFEPLGCHGIAALEKLISYAKKKSLLTIIDVKRGDVPSTAQAYANAYLGNQTEKNISPLTGDAVTLHPFLGRDSLEPFFKKTRKNSEEKGVFVCLKTSNHGSADLQDLQIKNPQGNQEQSVSDYIADHIIQKEILQNHFSSNLEMGYSNIGVVVGSTFPEEAKLMRKKLPHSFFLVPGFGAQQGSIKTIKNYINPDGLGALFSFSRSVIYPPSFQNHQSNKKVLWKELKEAINKEVLLTIKLVKENLSV